MLYKKIDKLLNTIIFPLMLSVFLESVSAIVYKMDVIEYNNVLNIIVGPVFFVLFLGILVLQNISQSRKLKLLSSIYLVMGIVYLILSKNIVNTLAVSFEFIYVFILIVFLGLILILKFINLVGSFFKREINLDLKDELILLISVIINGIIFSIIGIIELVSEFTMDNIYDFLSYFVSFLFYLMPIIVSFINIYLIKSKYFKTSLTVIGIMVVYFLLISVGIEIMHLLLEGFLYKAASAIRIIVILNLFFSVCYLGVFIKKVSIITSTKDKVEVKNF